MWCVPELDENYIKCMEDVLDVYEKPLDKSQPVVCVDEKPLQLLKDLRAGRKDVAAGKPRTYDYAYERNGVANIFCAVEPRRGKYIAGVAERKTGREFAEFVRQIAGRYKDAERIHLVMDNYGTHKEKSLVDRYGEERGRKLWERFEVHYTPRHASWLNQAEIGIFKCVKECLGKRRFGEIEALSREVRHWQRGATRRGDRINWRFTSKKAREKFKYNKFEIRR